MSIDTRRTLHAALLAGLGAGMASAGIPHYRPEPRDDPLPMKIRVQRRRSTGSRSNEKLKLAPKEKKRRKAKIARASRRLNLRA